MQSWAVVSLTMLFLVLPCRASAGPVFRVDLEAGRLDATAVEPAPRLIKAAPAGWWQRSPPEPVPPGNPESKIHPRLLKSLHSTSLGAARVVIAFADDVEIPRFPDLDPNLQRGDPRNAPAMAAAAELVRELKNRRSESYKRHEKDLADGYGAKVIETFWLIDAVVAEMPPSNLLALASRQDVLSIAPVDSGESPPDDDGNDKNDVDDGRAQIASNPYDFLTGGFVGLLDTGIRRTHRQFNGPSTIDLNLDCVSGGADCVGGDNPDDDCWNHGTSTAAILTGNNTAVDAFRGVTKITLDSFKIYPSVFDGDFCDSEASGLDTAAAVRGFQAAVAALDQVIVAQIQQDSENGPIARAANAAFDAGAVVVAANGNGGEQSEDGSVAEPASTSRVLGVGNFHVIGGAQINSQGRGPGIGGRIKPDIQAPTFTETAGNGCLFMRDCRAHRDDKAFRVFTGTSGATPYAAGAAALMRNLIARVMRARAVDPGFVYSLMILSGQRPNFDNDHGTGPIRLPTGGTLRWGVVTVSHGESIEVPIRLHPHHGTIDAALWWPEEPGRHNNIDLKIVDPNGKEETSRSLPSVFERARVSGARKGKWRIEIHGQSVPVGPQRVYFAIFTQS